VALQRLYNAIQNCPQQPVALQRLYNAIQDCPQQPVALQRLYIAIQNCPQQPVALQRLYNAIQNLVQIRTNQLTTAALHHVYSVQKQAVSKSPFFVSWRFLQQDLVC
jgi:hypothetical protein